jgi:hypothetical protein
MIGEYAIGEKEIGLDFEFNPFLFLIIQRLLYLDCFQSVVPL